MENSWATYVYLEGMFMVWGMCGTGWGKLRGGWLSVSYEERSKSAYLGL